MRLHLSAAVVAVCALAPSTARSQDARCRRIRASAESQAFLLFSPTLWAEGVHVPLIGDETGMGYVQGGAWQLRGAISMSPLDVVRGAMTLDIAGVECRQLDAASRARRVLELGENVGTLAAARAQHEALTGARPEIDAIVARAENRLAEGLATEAQLVSIRAESARIARLADQIAADLDRLIEAGHDDLDPTTIRADLEAYERASIDLERQRSSLRRLNAWTLQVRGGVVPVDRVDWFGQVQLGFNLGGVAQQIAEDHVVRAREDELAESREELRSAVERLERRLAASLPDLRGDLAHVERQIAIQQRQRELLASMQTSEVEYLRAMTDLTLVGLRAERARVASLIEARAPFESREIRERETADAE